MLFFRILIEAETIAVKAGSALTMERQFPLITRKIFLDQEATQ